MHSPGQSNPRSTTIRYAIAIAIVLLAWLGRTALTPSVGPTAIPFALFFPAVALASWFGRVGPGILAALLSVGLGRWFFMSPAHSWGMGDLETLVSCITFLFAAFVIAFAMERMHQARADQVTKQQQAYEANEQLAAIVEHSGDVILTKNLNGTIQTWNASAERLFGYRPQEIVGRHVTTLFPPDRLREEDHILDSLRQGRPVERFETVRVAKDGRQIPVAVSVSPLKNREGELIGASKVVHDITDLVAARLALQQEKELLATTLASIGDAVVVTDAQGRITFLNAEAERLTGWKNAEALGRPLPEVFRIINEQTRAPVANPVETVLRHGGVVGLANHTLLIAKDGSETPIDDSAAPIRQADGPLFGVVLVFRDITDQKAAAQALHEREQELEAVIDQTPFMLTRCSRDLRYRFVSRAYAQMLGRQPQEIAGRPIVDVMGDTGFKTIQPHVEKVLQGQRVEYETEVDFRDVGMRYLHVVYVPDYDLHGNIRGWIASLLEITARKEAERKLRELATALEEKVQQRTKKLQETIEELEGFSYSITHDLRAPLRAMQGFANILAESHENHLDETGRELLRRIGVAAIRMDRLVSDVLVYSHVLRMDLKVEPMNVDALLRGMLETYPNLQKPAVDILIEGKLPMAVGNEAALTQCFSNLLGNAVKFVDEGVKPRVRISAETRGRKVRFYVTDNGIGIEPKYLQTIFGMFQRLSSKYEGTGIGLTLVRKAAERMGGSVGVESELGRGSRFWLELPLAEAGTA